MNNSSIPDPFDNQPSTITVEAELTTKTIVEFLMPGSLYPEEITQEVASRNPLMVVVPNASVFAFSFYDSITVTINGEEMGGKTKNPSARFYVGGTLYSIDQLPQSKGFDILRDNMKCNGWKKVIETRAGNWQPFNDDDTLLPASADAERDAPEGGRDA